MADNVIRLSADRPALEYEIGGEVRRWEYDILPIKLECERLEKLHAIENNEPSTQMLTDLQAYFIGQGLEHCSIDLALKLYYLNRYQFAKLWKAIGDGLEQAS